MKSSVHNSDLQDCFSLWKPELVFCNSLSVCSELFKLFNFQFYQFPFNEQSTNLLLRSSKEMKKTSVNMSATHLSRLTL